MTVTDDAAREQLLSLPWRAGEAPFRIKGVAYRGHVDYCDRFVPGGHAAVLATLGRPDLDAFFDQTFLASSRYDVFPLAIAGIGGARVTGKGFFEFVRERTRWQAREDVNGIYRFFLRLTSPELVAKRLPNVVAQYFDFGDAETEVVERGAMRSVRRGVPRPLASWYAISTTAYFDLLLELAGARDVKSSMVERSVDGQLHGIDVVSMALEASWTAD